MNVPTDSPRCERWHGLLLPSFQTTTGGYSMHFTATLAAPSATILHVEPTTTKLDKHTSTGVDWVNPHPDSRHTRHHHPKSTPPFTRQKGSLSMAAEHPGTQEMASTKCVAPIPVYTCTSANVG